LEILLTPDSACDYFKCVTLQTTQVTQYLTEFHYLFIFQSYAPDWIICNGFILFIPITQHFQLPYYIQFLTEAYVLLCEDTILPAFLKVPLNPNESIYRSDIF